jgi:hypothetical protein
LIRNINIRYAEHKFHLCFLHTQTHLNVVAQKNINIYFTIIARSILRKRFFPSQQHTNVCGRECVFLYVCHVCACLLLIVVKNTHRNINTMKNHKNMLCHNFIVVWKFTSHDMGMLRSLILFQQHSTILLAHHRDLSLSEGSHLT